MKLQAYLLAKKLKGSQFAKLAGLHVSTVSRAKNDLVLPSRRTMAAITKATKGRVSAVDFY